MSELVRISLPITTCRRCGETNWNHVKVLGAVGVYCRPCASFVAPIAAHYSRQQISDGIARGHVTIPTPLLDLYPLETSHE